jgi:hypothetical protein
MTMRKSTLIAVLLAGAVGLPLAAGAQGVTSGSTVTTGHAAVDAGIPTEQRKAFRNYVIEEKVPSYTVTGDIRVGTILPEAGVTFYDVPQRFAATSYRYTIVNDHTLLVDPETRRVIQVIE